MSQSWIDLLAKCDIYEHIDLALHQLASGGGWIKLEWDRGACRGIDVERELKRLGVPICGRWFTSPSEEHPNGTLSCYVPENQARRSEYSLVREFGPIFVGEPIDAKSIEAAMRRQGEHIPAWSERGQSRPSVPLSEMNFAAPKREEEAGPVKRLVKWLRDG